MHLLFPLIFIVFITGSLRSEEIALHRKSHPLNPDDRANFNAAYLEPILQPRSGVKALEQQQKFLKELLASFPPIESLEFPPRERFGYMSQQLDLTGTKKPVNQWVEISFPEGFAPKIASIAIIPAYFPKISNTSNFAFPKRFKIEVLKKKGKGKGIKQAELITVVDWTEQDFPDPGLHPVIFNIPTMNAYKIRFTVTRGAIINNKEFFALDEVMVFRSNTSIASSTETEIKVSSSTTAPPYWSPSYLRDREIHLGKYLHKHKSPLKDFVVHFPDQVSKNQPVEILIDLEQRQALGRIEIRPAKNPKTANPEYPIPINIRYEFYNSENGEKSTVLSSDGNSVTPLLPTKMGRHIRMLIDTLPQFEGEYVLAIGEIQIFGNRSKNSYNLAEGAKITIKHFPKNEYPNSNLLVDGYVSGREILEESNYIEQLAKRQLVEKALHRVNQKLPIARAVQTQRYWTIGISSLLCLIFLAILSFIRLKHEKRKAVYQIQQQISDDLHDDISGNLGTISMISGNLKHMKNPELLDKKVLEINHLAQECFMSLKEIIWHTGEDTIQISDLFEQIERTAKGILTNSQIDCQFPTMYENFIVPADTRRNIILLAKETLYNCAKYAEANHICISAQITETQLNLIIQDDGKGFDPSDTIVKTKQGGRGLENMKKRAKMLGAKLNIDSAPGKGTTTTLKMPIKSKIK